MARFIFVLAFVFALLGPSQASAEEMTYKSLLVGWIKLQQEEFNYKANSQSLLQVFYPDTFRQVEENEFKLGTEKEKTVGIVKEKVKGFDLKKE